MKTILFLSLFFPALSFAQDCSLKKEKDPFTQQPKIATGFIKLNAVKAKVQSKVQLNMVADAKEVKLLFSFGEGVCFDEQSAALFSFDSTRTKASQRNSTAMNCDGIYTVVFRNAVTTPGALQKMATNKVSSIVITGTNGDKWEITLTEEQKLLLRQKAGCLITEAKTLLQPAS